MTRREAEDNGLITQRTYDANTGWTTGINTGVTAGGGTVQNWTFAYDALGNLNSRNDATQIYNETSNTTR